MKKILALLLLLITVITVTGCDSGDFKYINRYSAVGMLRSNTKDSCRLSFQSLDGQIVYKLKYTKAAEGCIFYEASIKEGELNIYYDVFGAKEHLFMAQAGYPIEGEGGYIEGGKTVYVIIEAADAKDGTVEIWLGR